MVAKALEDKLGIGLYTPAEAARYARVPTQTLTRWLWGNAAGPAVVRPQLEGDDKIVTFWDLIQMVAIRQLRQDNEGRRVPLQHIREVVDMAREDFNLPYPLARDHTIYVYDKRLLIQIGDQLIGTKKGLDRGQHYEHKIMEPFLTELEFGKDDLAESYEPLTMGEKRVRLAKDRRFGQPVIEPYGILASTLVDAVVAEGSVDAAAAAYEVDPVAVRLAQKWELDYLGAA